MHDVHGKRAVAPEVLCGSACHKVRVTKAQKYDHCGQDLAAYERNRDALLVSVKLKDCCGAADCKQDPQCGSNELNAKDPLFVSSYEHARHGVGQAYEDRISKLVAFADTEVRQDNVRCDECGTCENRVLQDARFIKREHDEKCVEKRA